MNQNNFKKFDFVCWENIFSEKEIKNLNNFIEKNYDFIENKEQSATDEKKETKKNALVKCISYFKIKKFIKNLIYQYISFNNKYIGYHLYNHLDNDCCNLNIYSHKNFQEYDWHIDGDLEPFSDIKLTVLINLSIKPYTGGNFFIFNNTQYEIPGLNKPGNMIMFKSFLNHKVMPVITGERRTLSIFLKGPAFK